MKAFIRRMKLSFCLSLLMLGGSRPFARPPERQPKRQLLVKKELQDGLAVLLWKRFLRDEMPAMKIQYRFERVETIGEFLKKDYHIGGVGADGEIVVLFLSAGKKPVLLSKDSTADTPGIQLLPYKSGEPIRTIIDPLPYDTVEAHFKGVEELHCQLIKDQCGFVRPFKYDAKQRNIFVNFLLKEMDQIINHELPAESVELRKSAVALNEHLRSERVDK